MTDKQLKPPDDTLLIMRHICANCRELCIDGDGYVISDNSGGVLVSGHDVDYLLEDYAKKYYPRMLWNTRADGWQPIEAEELQKLRELRAEFHRVLQSAAGSRERSVGHYSVKSYRFTTDEIERLQNMVAASLFITPPTPIQESGK